MICLISLSKSPDVLPVFACARAIGHVWGICLGVNILSQVAKSERRPFPCVPFIGNILLLKELRINSRP